MGLAFATRKPTADEVKLLRKMLSTYRDGSGTERESDGSTRPGWRQMERCLAELLGSEGAEEPGRIPRPALLPEDYFFTCFIEDSPRKDRFNFKIIIVRFVPESRMLQPHGKRGRPRQPVSTAAVPFVGS